MKQLTTLLKLIALSIAANYAQAQNISINNPNSGTGYTWNSTTLTITDNGTYNITGTGAATTNRIVVSSGITANITLNGVNIDVSATTNACALDITGATVNLTITNDNILKSGTNEAGLQVPNGATITINGTGNLTATGGNNGAGIGGRGNSSAGGTINISGGTVAAIGGYGGAGIGGGYQGAGGDITISGGTVTAYCINQGDAGIGGGNGGAGGTINISGGNVTATGSWGAGIGGGSNGAGGTINISGGSVTATGGINSAGIGGGYNGAGGTVTISGGTIKATRGSSDAMDIGKGSSSSSSEGTLTITGGSIYATNGSIGSTPTNGSGSTVYLNTLTVGATPVLNTAITAGSINGVSCALTPDAAQGVYGIKDVKTDNTGKVYLWLPVSANDGTTAERITLGAGNINYVADAARTASGTTVTLNQINLLVTSTDQVITNTNVYTFIDNIHTIKADGIYNITGTSNTERITVSTGVTADITLDNVNIDVNACAFDMTGANVNLTITNNNVLKSGNDKAGLQVPYGATITINGTGSLTATGDYYAAGIGGGSAGNITISGGTVTATGGDYAAGIGGGRDGAGGNITISGGNVTATGGNHGGAGIGGGDGGAGGDINISGGNVTATGSNGGAGIGGGGYNGAGGNITISGGTIKATRGSSSAMDIGKGGGNSGTLIITGGSIYATNGSVDTPTNGSVPVYLNTLTVGTAPVLSTAITAGSINGVPCALMPDATQGVYGIKDVKTDDTGKVYLYLPSSGNQGADVENVSLKTDKYYRNNTARTTGSTQTLQQIDLLVTSTNMSDLVYEFANNIHTIKANGTYNITGTTTIERIVVEENVEANITLHDLNINVSAIEDACALDITGATVNLIITGIDSLKSGSGKAGIQTNNATLYITDETDAAATPATTATPATIRRFYNNGYHNKLGDSSLYAQNDEAVTTPTTATPATTATQNAIRLLYNNGYHNKLGDWLRQSYRIRSARREPPTCGSSLYAQNDEEDAAASSANTPTPTNNNALHILSTFTHSSEAPSRGRVKHLHAGEWNTFTHTSEAPSTNEIEQHDNYYIHNNGKQDITHATDEADATASSATTVTPDTIRPSYNNGYHNKLGDWLRQSYRIRSARREPPTCGSSLYAQNDGTDASDASASSATNNALHFLDSHTHTGDAIHPHGWQLTPTRVTNNTNTGDATLINEKIILRTNIDEGKLIVTGGIYGAGIGGGLQGAGGTITINGGTITATGGEYGGGAGIGGGNSGDGGNITINGGTITATGRGDGAGIGGGDNGAGGDITINEGAVTATGGTYGAGIGGGKYGVGGTITINGGTVTATGGAEGAGIGGGDEGDGGTITIIGGNVTATGGSYAGAGIGGGDEGNGGTININGGTITATGGDEGAGESYAGAGIGGGYAGDGGNITISAGNVTATGGGKRGAGIGGGYNAAGGTITISGGNVTATGGGERGAGIGGGSLGNGGTINISGGNVTATGGSYGSSSVIYSGAGIGGGQDGDGGTITISGGTVTATGGCSAAGIGGGDLGNGGIINITGGTVTATGGSYTPPGGASYSGAGIGGGHNRNGGTINISGGTIIATGNADNGGEDIGKGGGNSTSSGTLTITGGSIYPTNGSIGAIPNNGNSNSNVYLNTLTVGSTPVADSTLITAGSINGVPCATTADPDNGVYGIKDVVTDSNGKVYFWLTTTINNELVSLTANDFNYANSYIRYDNNNNAQTLNTTAYGIALNLNNTFDNATYGYDNITPLNVTVTNTGYENTGTLNITLTGENEDDFNTSVHIIDNITTGSYTSFNVNPNAGLAANTYTATVNVTGTDNNDNNFNATLDVSFTVLPRSITAAGITLTITGDTIYTGTQLTPAYTVDDNVAIITEDDYEAVWGANIQCSTGGSVTLTGQGNYTGSLTRHFTILRRDISGAIVTLTGDTVYTGIQLTPAFTVDDSEATISSADYTVSTWGENIEVSTGGNVTLTGQGNYTGSLTHSFNILPRNIANATIIITGSTLYNGSQLTPDFEVTDDATITDADYTVSWDDNVQCSTGGRLTLTGTNNYTGILTHSFTILRRDISSAIVTLTGDTVYTGSQLTPDFEVTDDSQTINAGNYEAVWGENIHAGISAGTLTLTGTNNYTGSLTHSFNILPRDISGVIITITGDTVYTGTRLTPEYTVVGNGATITADDYNVSWNDNIQCSTGGSVTLTGQGNYTGSLTHTFNILPRNIANVTITITGNTVYTGTQLTPAYTVVGNGATITAADYNVSWDDNIQCSTGGSVTLTGTGNYTGSLTHTFNILPRNISNATITITGSTVYTGSQLTPDFNVTDNGAIITAADYTVHWDDNVQCGTGGTVTLTGTNNYNGNITQPFNITPRDISNATIIITGDTVYTGSQLTPDFNVIDNEVTITTADYTVSWESNVQCSTGGKLTLTGKDNCTGSLIHTFTISKAPLYATATDTSRVYGDPNPEFNVTYAGFVNGDNESVITAQANATCDADNTSSVGEYTINVSGGTASNYDLLPVCGTLAITPRSISPVVLTVTGDTVYTGSQLQPDFEVIDSEATITDADYTVSWGDNVQCSTGGTVTLTGANNYTGSVTQAFHIDKATPTPQALHYTIPEELIYDGNPHPVEVEVRTEVTPVTQQAVDLHTVLRTTADAEPLTVKYNGYTDLIPRNAGNYHITVDIPEQPNYININNLDLGILEILKRTPDTLCFDYNIEDIPFYDGLPHPVNTDALDTIDGLGEVTVLYDGYKQVPVYPGTYEVALSIAEGLNYDALPYLRLGSYTIPNPPPMPTLMRTVRFISIPEGAAISPFSTDRTHYHINGNDLTFTLITGTQHLGLTPVVSTAEPFKSTLSYIDILPNDNDSTYTVIIYQLRENIDILISFTSADGNIPSIDNDLVWSTGKQLLLKSNQDALARIYNPSGTLVQTIAIQANQLTQIPLPTGLYIVTLNKQFYKVLVKD